MVSPTEKMLSPRAAYDALTEHPRYRYRSCAPDVDDPTRAAGNLELSVDAWGPLTEGVESQQDREEREAAAVDACVTCPVMVACAAYANTVGADGRLVEPYGVRGGERALERHKRLIASRRDALPEAAPDRFFATEQMQELLRALARRTDPVEVARVAGMDLRTANWQRSRLTTKLGLPKSATRAQVLEKVLERGLLAGPWARAPWLRMDDGSVPAVVTAVRGAGEETGPVRLRTRGPRLARSKFASIAGQLGFDDLPHADEASVHTLFSAKPLEAAA